MVFSKRGLLYGTWYGDVTDMRLTCRLVFEVNENFISNLHLLKRLSRIQSWCLIVYNVQTIGKKMSWGLLSRLSLQGCSTNGPCAPIEYLSTCSRCTLLSRFSWTHFVFAKTVVTSPKTGVESGLKAATASSARRAARRAARRTASHGPNPNPVASYLPRARGTSNQILFSLCSKYFTNRGLSSLEPWTFST